MQTNEATRAGRTSAFRRVPLQLVLCFVVASALGLWLTAGGMDTHDSYDHLSRGLWLLDSFGWHGAYRPDQHTVSDVTVWYGPLWELALGALTWPLGWLRDPTWVRHAFNFALFPVTLLSTFHLLRKAHVQASTAWLAVSFVLGAVRLGGHSVLNTNDFPLACAFLVATPALLLLVEAIDTAARSGSRLPIGPLALAGFVSVVPYLVRPPLLLHFAGLLAYLLVRAFQLRATQPFGSRLTLVLTPALVGVLAIYALNPAYWAHGVGFGRDTVALFSHFPWLSGVRVFGRIYPSTNLPAWYPFVWLVVGVHPLVFVACVVAPVVWMKRDRARAAPRADAMVMRCFTTVTLVSWLAVLLARPSLYDEDRHLLFLYPHVLVLAALGLHRMPERAKHALAVAVAAGALSSFAHWGRYAYVYKSPLIGDRSAERFMGDYWGVCTYPALAALEHVVPRSSPVVLRVPDGPVRLGLARLAHSRFARRPNFGPYEFLRREPASGVGYYKVISNRVGTNEAAWRDLRDGRAKLVWQTLMPPGDAACAILKY